MTSTSHATKMEITQLITLRYIWLNPRLTTEVTLQEFCADVGGRETLSRNSVDISNTTVYVSQYFNSQMP